MGRVLAVVLLVVAAFLGGVAVGRQTAAPAAPAPGPVAVAPMGMAAKAPEPAPGLPPMPAPAKPAPFASLQALNGAGPHPAPSAPSGGVNVSGELLEVIQVPNFTYLRLKTAKGEEWAAVSTRTDLKTGQSVTVADAALMNNFASKTLNRTFENIWFGQLAQ